MTIRITKKINKLLVNRLLYSRFKSVVGKMVNFRNESKPVKINLTGFKKLTSITEQTLLIGDANAENTFENPKNVAPLVSTVKMGKIFDYSAPAMLLTVIRIKSKKL